MAVETVPTRPIAGQRPGTSGLRKKTAVFREPGYLENYVQAVIDGVGGVAGHTIVVGGDGRFFNDTAIGIILLMLAANGAASAIVGQGGMLSTPAVSNLIRTRGAFGGFVLSASHNPGGEDGDFGLKFNVANGGPAPESITDAIFARTRTIDAYRILAADAPPLHTIGTATLGQMAVEIIDPVADYVTMMERLVDFDRIRKLFASGFRLRFDGMHAVTGPYAKADSGRPAWRSGGNGGQWDPAARLRRPPSRSQSGSCRRAVCPDVLARRSRHGRRVRRRWRSQHRAGPRHIRVALGQPRGAGGQHPSGQGLCRRPEGHRALHADQPRRRPSGGAARRRDVRDADRVEILWQPARRRSRHDLRRGERRHRIGPCAREGRAVGRAPLA